MNCKNCKHWERTIIVDWPEPDTPANIGKCSMVVEIHYWDWEKAAQEQIADGKMGGENVYTHEEFGCVNHEPKQ